MIAAHAAPPPPQACIYGKERLHANTGLRATAFITPVAAVRIALAMQIVHDAQVISVRRTTWWRFAYARCSGVAPERVIYVVRLRYPSGLPFRLGRYDPGTLADVPVDAQTGEHFIGHIIGNARGVTRRR